MRILKSLWLRARHAARHYGVDHEVIEVDDRVLSDHLELFLASMDQPGIDGFNTSLISHACGAAGFPVALSGLGGDEMLGGYRYYQLEHRLRRVLPSIQRLPKSTVAWLTKLGAARLGTTESRLGQLLTSRGVADRHRAFRSLFSPAEVVQLSGRPAATSLQWRVDGDDDPRRQLATLDANTYLRPTLLRDADVHSMAHSVELRVPFVDRRVRDAVVAAPAPPTKSDLARAWGDRYLSAKAQEPKLTFRLPWDRWLQQVIERHRPLLEQRDPWRGHLDAAVAHHYLDSATTSPEPLRGWVLVSLARWLDQHANAEPVAGDLMSRSA